MEVNGKFLRLYTTKHGKFIVSWDCFKETINACLYHGFDNWVFVSYFYERMLTMSRGDFMTRSPEGVIQFLEYVADVSKSWDELLPRNEPRMNQS